VITDDEAMAMATAGRRLRDALQPRTDVEEWHLQVLVQVARVELIEALADMAERRARLETKQ